MNDATLIVGTITIFVTIVIDIINRVKLIKDNEPQLTFELRSFDSLLYLIIANTGKTIAEDIKINIKKIRNNGSNNLSEDFIFSIPFELNSNEKTQGRIGILKEDLSSHSFPYIDIEVSYKKKHFKKSVKYERQIFYNPDKNNNKLDEIKKTLRDLNNEIDKLRNPVLRLANYFDGHQVAPFDEINTIVNNSLQTDLVDAFEKKKNKIVSREECIDKSMDK